MAKSLSNFVDNITEEIHKIKWKYKHDISMCKTCWVEYFKWRNFWERKYREFPEFGVFTRKFDPVKYKSRSCPRKLILPKDFFLENLFFFFFIFFVGGDYYILWCMTCLYLHYDVFNPLINDNEATNETNQLQAICSLTAKELSFGYSRHGESENVGDNSNWEWEHERRGFNASATSLKYDVFNIFLISSLLSILFTFSCRHALNMFLISWYLAGFSICLIRFLTFVRGTFEVFRTRQIVKARNEPITSSSLSSQYISLTSFLYRSSIIWFLIVRSNLMGTLQGVLRPLWTRGHWR